MKKSKKKIIFFGDDTWIKLFPNYFQRHDGTTSFFVSDYTEVCIHVDYSCLVLIIIFAVVIKYVLTCT